MQNKRLIWSFGLLVIILLLVFYRKPHISFHDAIPELNTASIHTVLISDTREKSYYMDAKETEQLILILDNLVMKKKFIPNIPAFNTDAYLIFTSPNTNESFTIKLDYARNIIGINVHPKNMKQYIVVDNTDLFLFVQSFLN
ncbi:hypothetical protein [Lysinibacillus boronitolerans]|uniref:hypothetical protein n=1 Tax=Lysinibacillus boronitolerans TaxID=309788 RepID=UPI00289AAFDE|nr:hypothetical protein [Lysinibacillus boronitolerans]